MIAEVLLVLAGHDSSLFQGSSINPLFTPLLHPGEQQTLEVLARTATRYRRVRSFCKSALDSRNRYICALCSTLSSILKTEYESLVVDTEAKILGQNGAFMCPDSFVPISSVRAMFAEWDAPLKALELFVDRLEEQSEWQPGPLIDLLLERANSGVDAVSSLFSRIAIAVQKLWLTDLSAFLIHGTVSSVLPIAVEKSTSSSTSALTYVLQDGAMPSCVSNQTRESILYVGRAVATVNAGRNSKQFPRSMAVQHAELLQGTYPEDSHVFDRVISDVRSNVSEWLWLNVLTREDVENAVESLRVLVRQLHNDNPLIYICQLGRTTFCCAMESLVLLSSGMFTKE
jgi:gamma-tubulin complex component 4